MACVEHIDEDEQEYYGMSLVTYGDIQKHEDEVDKQELNEQRSVAAA